MMADMGNRESRMNSLDETKNAASEKAVEFVFREVRTAAELLEVLRLRYGVYRNSRLNGFCPENDERIAVDVFDLRARHFGLYAVSDPCDRLIGCIRVVSENERRHLPKFRQLASQSKLIADVIDRHPDTPLPLCGYSVPGKKISELYQNWVASGEHVVEGGRLCLDPEFRSVRLAVFMAEMTFALGFFGDYEVDRALVTCCTSQERFYARYGYQRVPGTGAAFWDKPQTKGVALMATPKDICYEYRGRLITLASEFDNYGFVQMESHTECTQVKRSHLAKVA
jgi:hypothetical protein